MYIKKKNQNQWNDEEQIEDDGDDNNNNHISRLCFVDKDEYKKDKNFDIVDCSCFNAIKISR